MINEDIPLGPFRVTVDELLSDIPCLYWGVIVCFSGAGSIQVLDGQNTTGDIIHTVAAAGVTTIPVIFQKPILTKKGLFIHPVAGVTDVLPLWESC